jgi:hypothetical protein
VQGAGIRHPLRGSSRRHAASGSQAVYSHSRITDPASRIPDPGSRRSTVRSSPRRSTSLECRP